MKSENKSNPRTIRPEKYYSSLGSILNTFDEEGRRLALRAESASDFNEWKTAVRAKLRDISGLDRMGDCPLKASLLESEELEFFKREKWLIQTEPEVWMPFYALIPHGLESGKKTPSIIATHGHGSAGKLSTAGRSDIPAIKDAIDHYHYDYGAKLCQEGYIVFCPDARGFGERREFTKGKITTEDELDEQFFLGNSCSILNKKALSLGRSLVGMWTWDLMRLIDYIGTRVDCDAERICCAGLSGGGLQTLWLSALDDRVKCTVISGNFFGFKDSILYRTRCDCSYVPRLCEFVDVGDIGALIAPRALLIESASEDILSGPRGLENATEQVAITRQAYDLLGVGERLHHYVFESYHRWDGQETSPFIERWL